MPHIKLYLDNRARKEGSPAPVKLSISMNGGSALQATGICVLPENWDAKGQKVSAGRMKAQYNSMLQIIVNKWETAMLKLVSSGEVRKMRTATELKKAISSMIDEADTELESPNEDEPGKGTFLERFKSFAETRKTEGNREAYRKTIGRMEAYDPELWSRNFEDINRHWLEGFEAFMSHTCKSLNSVAFHLRNIRAVFNDALDDEATTFYPFRRFKIRKQPTPKRSLSAEQLRTLATFPCEPYQEPYRDMFMLMFMLIGINGVDLFAARHSDIADGRLEYIRAKTHKPYSVKIEPEAAELLRKCKGRKHLVWVSDTYTNYRDYLHRMAVTLKQIGPMERSGRGGKKERRPLFPKLSQYWCRHSWATIAASLDIPKETIAAALGHDMGNPTTAIYIDFDRRKVDEANRRVIDWVLYGKR